MLFLLSIYSPLYRCFDEARHYSLGFKIDRSNHRPTGRTGPTYYYSSFCTISPGNIVHGTIQFSVEHKDMILLKSDLNIESSAVGKTYPFQRSTVRANSPCKTHNKKMIIAYRYIFINDYRRLYCTFKF